MNFALRLLRVLGTTLFSSVARILCGKYILFTQVFSWKLLFHELFHESCRNTVFLKESLFPKNMNFRVSCIWILITDTWKLRTFRKKMTSNLRAVFNNSVFPFDFPNFSLMLEVVQVPAAQHHHHHHSVWTILRNLYLQQQLAGAGGCTTVSSSSSHR